MFGARGERGDGCERCGGAQEEEGRRSETAQESSAEM